MQALEQGIDLCDAAPRAPSWTSPRSSASIVPPRLECAACGAEMELDEIADRCFALLEEAPERAGAPR